MSKKIASSRELLNRWRGIEEEEEYFSADSDDPVRRRRLHQLKQQWFVDSYHYLINLPEGTHIWCNSWEVMGPLLETFYNYNNDDREDSSLRNLWRRMSLEMRRCVQCVSHHHQAQETYCREYEMSSVGPLLRVLRDLDEERVTLHLREMNARLHKDDYHSARDNKEVESLVYEVLMFPILLDDQSLLTEFELFIEAVENIHELALAGHQQFPGVYVLLFCNRRVRTVGRRLARSMTKLRRATDLEPLQPLLGKFIGFLETEALPSASTTMRPRARLERLSIWLGFTSLLEFLEPPAFEEGILEVYPIFFDIVLNHISGDSADFSHAVTCLKDLFKMLGCKLWLRSTLSPSVMRNTLLGQCFHTRNEKIHKDILDLFPPFLQSLEALQDGEHEKQRRHFLYFLLHQVPASSNFNLLTRKMACKIALLIILRGYKMCPPCPPMECAHMWGPSLVTSLKDSSLHSSLRQPAFDLIQAIIISDATALMTHLLNKCSALGVDRSIYIQLNDGENGDDDDGLPFASNVEEKDDNCWTEFSGQSKITSQECRNWMCIPMLWIDVLVDIDASILPVSFCKAVFWARSHLVMVESENCLTMVEHKSSSEIVLSVRTWLSSVVSEISTSFGWKAPTGVDDGGGKETKNSIKVAMAHLPLIRMFNRLTAYFLDQIGRKELIKQWTWEPKMAESLILSLLDPNDIVRQFGKCTLEYVSNTRGLACGLKFLCSFNYSLTATFSGLEHALKVVQVDSVISKFHTLQHLFFLLWKLIKEGDSAHPNSIKNNPSDSLNAKYSSQGGFLMQPVFDTFPVNSDGQFSNVDLKTQDKFRCMLSEIAWPAIRKCLVEGKAFIDEKNCEMTCIRVLEILPVAFERLYPYFPNFPRDFEGMVNFEFMWLHDLMDWGKSLRKIIVVYWKRAVTSLLSQLRRCCSNTAMLNISVIENLILCDSINIDKLAEEASHLIVLLSKEASCKTGMDTLQAKASMSKDMSSTRKHLTSDIQPVHRVDEDVQILDSIPVTIRNNKSIVIDLSVDEAEIEILPAKAISGTGACNPLTEMKRIASIPSKCASEAAALPKIVLSSDNQRKKVASSIDSSEKPVVSFQHKDVSDKSAHVSQKQKSEKSSDKVGLLLNPVKDDKKKEVPKTHIVNSLTLECGSKLKNSSYEHINKKVESCISGVPDNSDSVIRQVMGDLDDDPFEPTSQSARQQPNFSKCSAPGLKRRVIQLMVPVANRHGIHRLEPGVKRFKPPRLDDWYRPILEIDYFAMVGLATGNDNENCNFSKLKEVPVSFETPEQYVDIFRPLVLAEFKAQLHNSFLEMSSWDEIYYGCLSVLSVERIDDFHLVRFVHEDNDSISSRSFSENDLVLLTKETPQSVSHEIHVVGKVERRERDNKRNSSILLIRFYFLNGSSRLNQARRQLIERSKWHASRVMSITPQLREFQALSSIKDIPLVSLILKPASGSLNENESKEHMLNKLSQPLQQMLRSAFNDSQLHAISIAIGLATLRKELKLSLIQGPPGTGKTRTIVAMVSGLLALLRGSSDVKNSSNGLSRHSHDSSINSRPKISQSVAIARAWQDAALAKQLNEDKEKNEKSTEISSRRRVLICAQSNAAVDELVSRISSEGLFGCDGKMYKPYLVRVGNVKTVHPNSLPFFIDTLVDHRLAEERMRASDATVSQMSSTALRSNLEKLAERIRFYEAKRANLMDGNLDLKSSSEDAMLIEDDLNEMSDDQLEVKLRKLYEQKKQVYKDLSAAQARERKTSEEIRTLKHRMRKTILKEAEIVVTTLSGCGGDLYSVCSESMSSHKFGSPSEHTLFDAVVIDEAAQALEPATLIPLQLLKSTAAKCIMVGDPKQLPATVLSNVASKFLYECSMFERLQRAGHPVTMLTKQYRMHPEICRFPSLHFYDSKLLNGEQMSSKSALFHVTQGLGPYVFYDIMDGKELRDENSGALSLYNEHEAEAAVELLRFFKKRYPSEFVGGRIGIITPYKCQLSLLRSRCSSAFGSSVASEMEFNTVDGFQGREVDILILSTVRAVDSCYGAKLYNRGSIGFVADVRRMNVALTRAKLSLWILGNARTLQTNHDWAALVKDAEQRDLIISVKRPYGSFFKTALREDCHRTSTDCSPLRTQPDGNVRHTIKPGKGNEPRLSVSSKGNAKGIISGNCNRTVAKASNNYSAELEDFQMGKRRAGDKDDISDASGKMTSNREIRGYIKHVHNKDNAGAGKKEFSRHTQGGKREDKDRSSGIKLACSDQQTCEGHKNMKGNQLTGPKKSLEKDKGQKDMETSTSFGEGGIERGKAPSQKHSCEDAVTKRKRQREAVDEILCSSLISSKKSDQSKKSLPARRPLSPASNVSGRTRPPKVGQGSSFNSALQGQRHRYQEKRGSLR